MKNILLLNVGTRNTLVKNFIQSAKGRTHVIVTDNFKLAPALYDADKYYVTKRWDKEGYWEEIESIVRDNDIGLIISLVDPELATLAEKSGRFKEMGVLTNTSNQRVISDCFDKFSTLSFIKDHGYPWIKSYISIESVEEALETGSIQFPLFSKPRKGSGSTGIMKINNIVQLRTVYREQTDALVQEFISAQEIGVDLYIDLISGTPVSIFAKKKLKMRAGETDKSVSYKNQKLFDIILSFAEEFGLKGVNDIDVFEINGEYYISEVNPRFGGGYIHAYAAGVDFPSLLINNMNGIINQPNIGNYEDNNYMMKYFAIKVLNEEEMNG